MSSVSAFPPPPSAATTAPATEANAKSTEQSPSATNAAAKPAASSPLYHHILDFDFKRDFGVRRRRQPASPTTTAATAQASAPVSAFSFGIPAVPSNTATEGSAPASPFSFGATTVPSTTMQQQPAPTSRTATAVGSTSAPVPPSYFSAAALRSRTAAKGSAPPSPFSFGAAAAPSTAPVKESAPLPPFSFGAAAQASPTFSLGTPPVPLTNAAQASAPLSPFSFGSPAVLSTTAAEASTTKPPFSFGAPPVPHTAPANKTTTFGSIQLGTTISNATQQPAATAKSTGTGFGAPPSPLRTVFGPPSSPSLRAVATSSPVPPLSFYSFKPPDKQPLPAAPSFVAFNTTSALVPRSAFTQETPRTIPPPTPVSSPNPLEVNTEFLRRLQDENRLDISPEELLYKFAKRRERKQERKKDRERRREEKHLQELERLEIEDAKAEEAYAIKAATETSTAIVARPLPSSMTSADDAMEIDSTPLELVSQTEAIVPTPSIYITSLVLSTSNDNRLGGGKRSAVYRAAMDNGDTPVAVSVLLNVRSKRATREIEDEMRALLDLAHHANLVRFRGLVRLNQQRSLGLVSELLVDHQTLSSRLYDGAAISDSVKLELLMRMLDGLKFLHANGLTHRNFSLDKVLVTADLGSLKIVGYGLPSLRNAAAVAADTSRFREAYASPELLKGDLIHTDTDGWKRSDIFAFTVAMAELLVEEPPWEGELRCVQARAVMNGQRPYGGVKMTVNGEPQVELDAMCRLGWHEDPKMRPSASALRDTLEKCSREWEDESASDY